MAEGKSRVRALRQSRRFADCGGNLRQRRLPHFGSTQRFDQHDDDRRHALGRGALQQRRVSPQRHAVRRKLRARRHAANDSHDSAAVTGRNAEQGRAPGNYSARTLGNFAARQRVARIRTRRRPQGRSGRAGPRRRCGQARRQTRHARIWHAAAHRSGISRPAKNAPARSDAFVAGHKRSARRLSRERMHGMSRDLRKRPVGGALRAIRRQFGNRGFSNSKDPTIPREESGHPIRHEFTRSIPSSQCMVCHIHPGTNMVATYFGYTWWDNESDGDAMYPKQQRQSQRGRKIPNLRTQS